MAVITAIVPKTTAPKITESDQARQGKKGGNSWNEIEKEIVAEIKRFKGKKTMIIIAHRFSTVEHCDRIYKLEKGKIIASGTPQEMLDIN